MPIYHPAAMRPVIVMNFRQSEFAAWCALQGFHEIMRAPTASLTERVKNSYESKVKSAYTIRMRFPVVFQAIPPPRDVIGNFGQGICRQIMRQPR
jgi:hypothetical protein